MTDSTSRRCQLVVILDKPHLSLDDKLAILRTIASLSDQVDRLETRLQLAEGKA